MDIRLNAALRTLGLFAGIGTMCFLLYLLFSLVSPMNIAFGLLCVWFTGIVYWVYGFILASLKNEI